MILDTVQAYVTAARRLMQDEVAPYRYADAAYLEALNFGLMEARRLRADLFIGKTVPQYSAVDSTAVAFEDQFRLALVYYMGFHLNTQDDEEAQDSHAVLFLTKFSNILTAPGV